MAKKQDIKTLKEAVAKLEAMQDEVREVAEAIDGLKDERQEAFDAKSEGWQEGERGQAAQSVIEKLETAHTDLESLGEAVETALDAVRDATTEVDDG